MKRAVLLGFTLIAFGAGFGRALKRPPAELFGRSRVPLATGGEASFETRFVSRRHDVTAHAASLVELGDGRVRAFWFSGSHEGALDVEILSATFDPATGWGDERPVVGPESTRRALWRHVVKVGNPTVLRSSDGTLWLFYVTVTVGGWGGSTVTLIRSSDDGLSWGPPRRLIGSPFFNLNTMVRGAPFVYADGTIGLPAYQSLLSGFSELLRVDPSGAVIDKQRLSTPGRGSQPTILPTSPTEAVALMRYSGRGADPRVTMSRTWDAGRHWTAPTKTPLRNPDAAVGGVALPEKGLVLVALNDVDVERDVLSLVVSADGGQSFIAVHRLEDQMASRSEPPDDDRYARTVEALARATDASLGDVRPFTLSSRRFMCWEPRCHFEFSYPFLLRTSRGEFHLLYTWNRAYIKHVRFNQAWLEKHLARASHAPTH